MVREQVGESSPLAHRDTSRTGHVILRDRLSRAGVGDLIMSAHEEGGLTVHDGFYPLTVAVEGEGRGRIAGDGDKSILSVKMLKCGYYSIPSVTHRRGQSPSTEQEILSFSVLSLR